MSLADLTMSTCEKIDTINFENISNKIKIPKRFQRNFVKDLNGKQSIMKAIFNHQLTNPLYFSYRRELDTLEIIDGQQRWSTLIRFITNEFALGKNTIVNGKFKSKVDISGLTYKQIIEEIPNGKEIMDDIFYSTYLPVILYDGTEAEIRQLFKELNSGSSNLKDIEILLATESPLSEQVREWNDTINFDKIHIETNRFTAAELILKLYYYFKHGAKKVNKKDLEAIINIPLNSQFTKTINDIDKFIEIIPPTAVKEHGKGTIRLLMYMLIDLRKANNVLITDYTKFFEYIDMMFKYFMKTKGKVTIGNKEYWWLVDMARRDDKDVIQKLSIEMDLYLVQQLKKVSGNLEKFNEISGIQLREKKRNITKLQRWQVLLNQHSICPHCNKKVHLGDEAHHVVRYSKGGPNEVANMVIMHAVCHKEHHKNDVPSNETEFDDIDVLDTT